MTIRSPRTNTSVFAVPRSIARSSEKFSTQRLNNITPHLTGSLDAPRRPPRSCASRQERPRRCRGRLRSARGYPHTATRRRCAGTARDINTIRTATSAAFVPLRERSHDSIITWPAAPAPKNPVCLGLRLSHWLPRGTRQVVPHETGRELAGPTAHQATDHPSGQNLVGYPDGSTGCVHRGPDKSPRRNAIRAVFVHAMASAGVLRTQPVAPQETGRQLPTLRGPAALPAD